MPSFVVQTPLLCYSILVERGCLARLREFIPGRSGKLFVLSTEDVWRLHGGLVKAGLDGRPHELLFFPGGEARKRLAQVEALAEQMVQKGGDRSSVVIAFGGGILTDVAGFLAAIFMRGVPVIQVPTTLLAQVDAAIGGKTGVNLVAGKNLIGSFHQPLAVLIDPAILDTLPEREYRAGLFEIIKHGVIADPDLFWLMRREPARVLSHVPAVVDRMICDSVRLKAEVVSGDEKEEDRRRILNFGHTFGHALEAETGYSQFLHGEAVAWGMKAAALLAEKQRILPREDQREITECVNSYGPFPPVSGIDPGRLAARLQSDKKTVQGRVHFVLPERIGAVRITADVDQRLVREAIEEALAC
ncbi:MAG TPA: 3-dehydroquinate synthase [Bryobacteraceae bacterium]|nr:3-dehydroquinate synthase [Bryobacteraceae bacterium]